MALTTGQGVLGTQFASAMKTYYLDPLNDNVVRFTAFLNRVEKNSEDVAGNFAYMPIISARNPGVGSRKDTNSSGPKLPAAGRQSYTAATFRMGYHYARGSISGPVMRASKNNKGSFAKALDVEMRGLMQRIPEELNRQLWSYGHGRAATLATNSASGTTFEVNSRAIFSAKINDRVHFSPISSFTAKPATGTTIVNILRDQTAAGAVSNTIHTIILAAATGAAVTAGTDALYFGGEETLTGEDTSQGQEMFGVPAMVDDGAVGADEGLGGSSTVAANAFEMLHGNTRFGGIDRTAAANVFWRAQVLQNPSSAGTLRPITVSLLEEGHLRSVHVGGAAENSLEWYMSPGMFATVGLLHLGDRIFNDFKKTIEGGFMMLEYNSRPMFVDRDAPRNMLFLLDMSMVAFLSQSGYEIADEDGSVLKPVSNRDAYEFWIYRDVQLGSRNCQVHTVIRDCDSVMQVEANV